MTPPDVLEQLFERVEGLERRVLQLEHRSPASATTISAPGEYVAASQPAPEQPAQSGSALTVIGIALLGIAGAYFLRALTASAVLPRLALSAIGSLYAIGWAVWALRNPRRFASGLLAATSLLIFAPMLWEMSQRFQAMSPLVAAAVLSAYLAMAFIAARGAYATPAFALLFAGSALTALALCIATRGMMPFITILLAMTLFVALQRFRGHALAAAPIVLLLTDAAIWALLFIYRAPASARPEYPLLSPVAVLAAPLLLLLVQATPVTLHTCMRRQGIAALDALQLMVAFALLAVGAFWIAPAAAPAAIGSLCLAFCAAAYWVMLAFRRTADLRTRRLFATWATMLLAWGLYLLVPASAAAACFAVAAVTAMLAARRLHSAMLRVHALVYLLLAAFFCGLPSYEWHAMVAAPPPHPAWVLLAAAAASIAAYAVCRERESKDSGNQGLHFALALLGSVATLALLTEGLLTIAGLTLSVETFHIALLRTIAICALALTLALGGMRFKRVAMIRVAYTLVGFAVLKLIFEDFRHGHPAFLAASIGIVAVTLIAVPRLAP